MSLVDTGTAAVLSLAYGYDNANNVHSITDGVNAANSQNFLYDSSDRITNASGVYGAYLWTYDKVGNRLSETVGSLTPVTYGYYGGNNWLYSTNGPSGATYGINDGNIASASPSAGGTASVFTYNQANHLSAESMPNAAPQSYAYDARGLMATRSVTSATPAAVYQYQYGQDGRLLEEQASGVAQADYVYLDGQPLAVIAVPGGNVTYLHDDTRGAPQVGTSATKAKVWSATYPPFGYTYALSGGVQQNLRLPGQVADPNTGMYHNGQRDLMPNWGRYLESDPIGLAGGMNTYGYALQNPFRWTDPSGLQGVFYYPISPRVSSARNPTKN